MSDPARASEPRPRVPKLACNHGLRRQAVVGSLLADVFAGRLRAGQHMVTQELAARYGVSHTPIREALIALAGLGVIDLKPNRGAVVREVTPKDVREVCDVRRLLECEAVRSACGRIDASELDALGRAFQLLIEASEAPGILDLPRYLEDSRELDGRLHDRIAASCGNSFLANELERLRTLFRAFRDVACAQGAERHDVRRLFEEARQHLAIVEALRAGDAGAAAHAMAEHIEASAVVWGELFGDRPGAVSRPAGGANRPALTGNAPPPEAAPGTPAAVPEPRHSVSRHRTPSEVCRGESMR